MNYANPEISPLPGNIQVASFDVWGTLIRSNPDHKLAQAQMIAEILKIPSEGFLEIMKQEDRAADAESDITGEQYGPEERLQRIIKRVGVVVSDKTVASLAEAAQDLAANYLPILLEDTIPESLAQIREAGLRVAIVSNTGFLNGQRMRDNLRAVGVIANVDYTIFSDEFGIAKPDARIFLHLSRVAGVDPSKIAHIGDNILTDYHGANNAGLNGVHLARSTEASRSMPSIKQFADALVAGA